MAVQIQFRRDTAAAWTAANPTLAAGELGLETDTSFYKIGNGSTAWNSLAYGSITGTLADTAVTPGTYTTANITVDSKGRITSASSGVSGIDAFSDQFFLGSQLWS